jgi:hypothetical protein
MKNKIRQSLLLVLLLLTVRNDADAERRSGKNLNGVVLKSEGYYCTIERGDSVINKPVPSAINIASRRGYVSAKEFFTGASEDTDTLQPGASVAIAISLRSNLPTNDETFSRPILLPKGTFQALLECRTQGATLYAPFLYAFVSGGESTLKTFMLDKKGKFSTKFVGTCTDGQLTITRLS